jgi:hypothetical protein
LVPASGQGCLAVMLPPGASGLSRKPGFRRVDQPEHNDGDCGSSLRGLGRRGVETAMTSVPRRRHSSAILRTVRHDHRLRDSRSRSSCPSTYRDH